ncbi:MAG: YeeE/YedE thiosulfate transporter family protein [Cyanobacteriota bacterium]
MIDKGGVTATVWSVASSRSGEIVSDRHRFVPGGRAVDGAGSLQAERYSREWCLAMVIGMVGAWLCGMWRGGFFQTAVAPWRLLLGGLLVGYGSRLSSGCTFDHGLMGMPSFSRASLQAVVVFKGVVAPCSWVNRSPWR